MSEEACCALCGVSFGDRMKVGSLVPAALERRDRLVSKRRWALDPANGDWPKYSSFLEIEGDDEHTTDADGIAIREPSVRSNDLDSYDPRLVGENGEGIDWLDKVYVLGFDKKSAESERYVLPDSAWVVSGLSIRYGLPD